MKISVIIPVYNEKNVIRDCLESLNKQTTPIEIIVVDDGSTDNSISNIKYQISNTQIKYQILHQKHTGPGAARNLGAKSANGEILVFVDADMSFAPDFIETLIEPIIAGKAVGTYSTEEIVNNWQNEWARCWNYNRGITDKKLVTGKKDNKLVFRAILKSEFEKAGGFTANAGYTDDWTLPQKLGIQPSPVKATYFHKNPDNLNEIFRQATWIGKSDFLSRNLLYQLANLVRYSVPLSLVNGLIGTIKYKTISLLLFKIVYDAGIFKGILLNLFGKQKYK